MLCLAFYHASFVFIRYQNATGIVDVITTSASIQLIVSLLLCYVMVRAAIPATLDLWAYWQGKYQAPPQQNTPPPQEDATAYLIPQTVLVDALRRHLLYNHQKVCYTYNKGFELLQSLDRQLIDGKYYYDYEVLLPYFRVIVPNATHWSVWVLSNPSVQQTLQEIENAPPPPQEVAKVGAKIEL